VPDIGISKSAPYKPINNNIVGKETPFNGFAMKTVGLHPDKLKFLRTVFPSSFHMEIRAYDASTIICYNIII
jgi:hypothetical protein